VELGEGKQIHLAAVEENLLTFLELRKDNSNLRCSSKIAPTGTLVLHGAHCQVSSYRVHFREDKVPYRHVGSEQHGFSEVLSELGKCETTGGGQGQVSPAQLSFALSAQKSGTASKSKVQSARPSGFCGPRLFKGATDRQTPRATNFPLCVRASDLRPFFGEVASTKQASSL
jgi:hypothetical protein